MSIVGRSSGDSGRLCGWAARSGLWLRGRLGRVSRRAVLAQRGPGAVSEKMLKRLTLDTHLGR